LDIKLSKSDIVYGNIRKDDGSIQSGYRPMYIIQNNVGNRYSPTVTVLPITSKLKYINQPTHTLIVADKENGLEKDSVILAEQITTINKTDIVKKVGRISDRSIQKRIFKCFLNIAAYGFGDKDAEEIKYQEA
jgi:mRNA interferase MazF